VETDVYRALRQRIRLFEQFVGKLQPILSTLPRAIATAVLADPADRDRARTQAASALAQQVQDAEAAAFDLDELTTAELDEGVRPEPAFGLDFLDAVLRHPALLPPGVSVRSLGNGEYEYSQPGMSEPLRVTTNAAYYDEHPDSVALWSPGNPLFPLVESPVPESDIARKQIEIRRRVRYPSTM
jgi:hypothetical protein